MFFNPLVDHEGCEIRLQKRKYESITDGFEKGIWKPSIMFFLKKKIIHAHPLSLGGVVYLEDNSQILNEVHMHVLLVWESS